MGVAPGVIGLGIASARVCARECLFTSAHVYAIECACITSVGAGVGEVVVGANDSELKHVQPEQSHEWSASSC